MTLQVNIPITLLIPIFLLFHCCQANSKICLTEYTDIKNLSFQLEPYTGQIVNVWIVNDGAPAYNCFNERKGIRERLKIRNRYRVLKDNYRIRADGKHWSLISNTNESNAITSETISGWVSHNNIIVTNLPMKNMETNIYQKVLIREGNCKNGQAFQVYNDRELMFACEAIEIKNFFYVYDFFPRSARTPESPQTFSLLIGIAPQLDTIASNAPILFGWVDQKKVTFWNSRTACEFKLNTRYNLYDNHQNILCEFKVLNKPFFHNELRYPILKETGQFYRIGVFSKLSTTQLRNQTKRISDFEKNERRVHDKIQIISKEFKNEARIGVISDDILNYAKKVIRANNIVVDEYNAFQQYFEGNISKNIPLKKCILVSKTELENISVCLTNMIEAKGYLQKRKEVWDNSLKMILGDQTCIENGTELSLEDCNNHRNGIPVKGSFMKYTKKQLINLSGQPLNRFFCEAHIAREQFRAFVDNRYIKSVKQISIDPCRYKLTYEYDLNGDGKIIHSNNASKNDRIDQYFFKDGNRLDLEEMAWIPVDHFSFIEE